MGRRRRRTLRLTKAAASTTKTEDGQSFPAGAYAYVPDAAKPSTWKLRLWEDPDGGPTTKQVGMALAALSPGGFRGQKVQIPSDALPAVKRKIFAAWKKVHPDDADVPAQLKGTEALAGGRSFDEVRSLVNSALQDHVNGWPWLSDLDDEKVSYETGNTHYQAPYDIDDDGQVTFGDSVEVEPRRIYVPVGTEGDGGSTMGGTTEARSDRIHGRVIEAKGTDSTGGRVFGVQIIAYGDSRNGRRYPESVMKTAVAKYEGAKAYDHHRTDEELQTSTITGLIGSYHNVTATREGLQGELHLLPSATHAAEALDASLTAQAEGLPPLVGISHDVMALYKPTVEAGKRFMEATEIVSVNSADVVADPAAGGRATRMVAGGTGAADPEEGHPMTLKELLALLRGATPEKRTELLAEHKAVLEEYALTDEEVGRMLAPPPAADPVPDPVDPPAPTPAPADADLVGAVARESVMGTMLIREAMSRVGLDARFVETITKRLPAKFTEAQLTREVEGYRDLRVELERERMTEGGGGAIPHVSVTGAERDRLVKMLDNMLDRRYRGRESFRSLKQAFVAITGRDPYRDGDTEDFNRLILRESYGVGEFDSGRRLIESAQTGTWNLILGDSITRRMVAEYDQPNLMNWRQVVSSVVPIQDFRTQRIERLGGYGVLPGVNEGAPYQPLTTPGNEEATYAISKRGGTEDLTLETIANDDLRMVQRIPTRLGLAAAQTLYRYVWDMFITNASYSPDSTSVFSSGHANSDSNALSRSAMDTGRKKMRKQTAYGDSYDILSIVPKLLVTVPDLEDLAFEICTSAVAIPTSAPDGGASNLPNLHQGLTPVIVDYWSATSTTAWFLVGDPDQTPTIELGFYQGREDPELFIQNDPTVGSVFTADKITWKIRHIYAGTPLDFRALYRGNS